MLNGLLIIALSSERTRQWLASKHPRQVAPTPMAEHVLQMVFLEPDQPAGEENTKQPRFARTTEAQRGERPERADFIGERDTQAASEQSSLDGENDLPSQTGISPRDPQEIETTESDYRDGPLDTPMEQETTTGDARQQETLGVEIEPQTADPAVEIAQTQPPDARERLLEGPLPTEIPIPSDPQDQAEVSQEATDHATPSQIPAGDSERDVEEQVAATPIPQQPAFQGYQRRTAIRGSISRTGPSALSVQDGALGRYQAIISRAVELEWQRNCVRHRDFITPGFLTVRFFVEPNGRVRTVEFVGQMETGEIQKGFTLNSIRNAAIPPMSVDLKAELNNEPLELIFNFFF